MTEEVKAPEVQQPATTATQPEANQQAPQGPDLNVTDLIALRNIVEIATQRGAFKASELEAVGKTFNKLNAFLEAVTNKKEA